MEAGYALLDHTADAALRAWGKDPAAAFAAATRGMFAIILGADPGAWPAMGRAGSLALEVRGEDWPDLLVNWLAEVLFLFEVEQFVPVRIEVTDCIPPTCAGRLEGVYVEDEGKFGGVGIKAVTYHQLAVTIGPDRTELQVVFDI
jgi:SHS2 domain-containing protein